MANIKISIDAPILPDGSGLVHESTDWRISRYPDFTRTEYLVYESLADTENLTTLYYNDELDTALYVIVRYNYNNGLSSEWSRTIPIKSGQVGFKVSSTVVLTPKVDAKVLITNRTKEVKIESSPMKLYAGVGEHIATSYLIEDGNGNVVFSREEDKENLTSLTLNYDFFKDDKVFVVRVKYHTDVNVESNYGTYLLDTDITNNNVYDVKLVNTPKLESDVYLEVIPFVSDFYSMDVIIQDLNGLTVASNLGQTTLTPVISTNGLSIGEDYCILTRMRFTNNVVSPYYKVWCGSLVDNVILPKDPNATYINEYTFTQEFLLKGYTVQSSIELVNGDILLTKHHDNNIYYYTMYADTLVERGIVGSLNGYSDLMDEQYLNFIPLSNGKFIIDYYAVSEVHSGSPLYNDIISGDTDSTVTIVDDGENIIKYAPRFALFSYDPVNHILTKEQEVIREDEEYTTSVANSYEVMGDYIYYIPAMYSDGSTLSIRTVNINDLTITTKEVLPDENIKAYANLAYYSPTQLMITGGATLPYQVDNNPITADRVNDIVWLYDINTGTYIELTTLPAMDTSLFCLQSYVLRNYDIMFVNGVYSGASLGNQDTYIYDVSEQTFIVQNIDMFDSMAYRNTVRLRKGDVLRISSRTTDPQLVYLYPATRADEIIIASNDSVDRVTNLVVNAGETITITNPYLYDTVDVLGTSDTDTGVLQWLDGETILEFRYKDLLVPHDRTLTESEAAKYDTITTLAGATLTVVPD